MELGNWISRKREAIEPQFNGILNFDCWQDQRLLNELASSPVLSNRPGLRNDFSARVSVLPAG